jgi:hypothetical protein
MLLHNDRINNLPATTNSKINYINIMTIVSKLLCSIYSLLAHSQSARRIRVLCASDDNGVERACTFAFAFAFRDGGGIDDGASTRRRCTGVSRSIDAFFDTSSNGSGGGGGDKDTSAVAVATLSAASDRASSAAAVTAYAST